MTCSTFCCLCDTYGSMERTYICMYVEGYKTTLLSQLHGASLHHRTRMPLRIIRIQCKGKHFFLRVTHLNGDRENCTEMDFMVCTPISESKVTMNGIFVLNLMYMDLCIIIQFIKKIQQDATMYRNFYYSIFI